MIDTRSVATEHHARLGPGVDHLAATAELIGSASTDDLRQQLDTASAFLNDLLLPHMSAVEQAIYPELERRLQNVHSMSPMRAEHAAIRALVADLDALRAGLGTGHLATGKAISLRRDLYRLHAILKIHMAEEQLYADIVEHGLSADAAEALRAAMEHAGSSAL
ncbi:MAG: hemerythrin domain-containing protein [Chloroflexi bacterium]|nr:hemerythrin domain-containing protein [Chloroflexota bacterium]